MFLLPIYNFWCNAFKETPRLHRKQWEFVYIAQALYERKLLAPGKRGLGFGVGMEPLADLFCSFGCEMVASDLDFERAQKAGWADTQQHSASAEALYRGISRKEDFDRLLSFRIVDMNDIPTDLRGFDFCYSSCSMEHVGSLDLSKRFVANSLETLRPGGVAIHTTELNIGSDTETVEIGPTVLWRKSDFRELAAQFTAAGHEVAPLDFELGSGELDKYIDLPPYNFHGHLRLRLEEGETTSFGLIVRKGGAAGG